VTDKIERRQLTRLERAIEYTEKAAAAIGKIPITDDPENQARNIYGDMKRLAQALRALGENVVTTENGRIREHHRPDPYRPDPYLVGEDITLDTVADKPGDVPF